MNRHNPGRAAAGSAAALAVAGLLIAGCSSGSGNGSGTGSGSSSSSGGSQASTSGSSSGGQSSSTTTTAGSPLFPIAVGEKWVYISHVGGGSSRTINTIKAVKPTSGGDLVTMTDASHIPGAPARPTKVTYMFHSDGSISVPFSQFNGGKVTIKSGSIVWPPAAVIASGQSHTSVLSISVNTGGQVMNMKVHVTVKGAGTASVTVPAGTYHATIVDQTQAETFLGHRVSTEIRTWLAPNVGPVKSEVVSKSAFGGAPVVVEELQSFTK